MALFLSCTLRERRLAAGVTRERLADQIGRSYSSVVAYECGRAVPPSDVLGAIAEALSCPVADFFEHDDRLAAA